MEITSCYVSDIGTQKTVNQDSLAIKVAETPYGRVAMAVVCDGMGGLSKGELASAEVVRAFEQWFLNSLLSWMQRGCEVQELSSQWNGIVQQQNIKLVQYGHERGIRLGTTATVLLLLSDRYYLLSIGDSRAYEITDVRITCLTHDHSFVMREVDEGRLTRQQAENDPRRNILLQCIGASKNVEPDFFEGVTSHKTTYLLCTDGFRHRAMQEEMRETLCPSSLWDANTMNAKLSFLVEQIKQRGEQDNITAVILKTD